MNVDVHQPIGNIAVHHPQAIAIFEHHGLDFCCGGKRSLAEACTAKGIDPAAIATEIEQSRPVADETDWSSAPLSLLVDHILHAFHAKHRADIPRLESLLVKVSNVHGHRDPEMFRELQEVFAAIAADLEVHMEKEEKVLFPWIGKGSGAPSISAPVRVMTQEHDEVAELLGRLRQATGDYQVPEAACASWRALWEGLELLERDLHEHIHLENNVLFPRSMANR